MKGYVLNEIINKIWIKLKRNRIDRKKKTLKSYKIVKKLL